MAFTIIVTFILSIIINYIIIKFKTYPKIILDYPDKERKNHLKPTPKIGIIFLIPLIILFDITNGNFEYNCHIIFFSLILILVGILDDTFSIKWNLRIFFEVVLTLSYLLLNENLILNNLNFEDLTLKKIFLGENLIFFFIFTIFCFIALVNAWNFYDGINNQLSQYLIILSMFFFIETNNNFFLVLVFSLIIFSVFNFQSKVFFGSASIYFLSFLFFNFSLFYHNNNVIGADEILLMLLYPGLDMARLFFSRVSKKSSPFTGDRNHIHHILSLKFDTKKILIINNIPVIISFIITQFPQINNLYGLIFVFFYYILILNIKKKS